MNVPPDVHWFTVRSTNVLQLDCKIAYLLACIAPYRWTSSLLALQFLRYQSWNLQVTCVSRLFHPSISMQSTTLGKGWAKSPSILKTGDALWTWQSTWEGRQSEGVKASYQIGFQEASQQVRGSCCIGCADQWLERRIRCDAQPRLDDGYMMGTMTSFQPRSCMCVCQSFRTEVLVKLWPVSSKDNFSTAKKCMGIAMLAILQSWTFFSVKHILSCASISPIFSLWHDVTLEAQTVI